MILLDIQRLSVHFGAVRACDAIDLRVEAGELIGIVGPNGSGKTTLFRAICGDIEITEGRVIWQGRDITGWPTDRIARHGLVRTFQQSTAFLSASVSQNLRMAAACAPEAPLREHGLTLSDIPAEPGEVLDFIGLGNVANTPAGALPTGMLRILGVALTLVTRPSMLMLDEPAAGLNVQEASQLSRLLRRIHEAGVTLAVVDHDMSFVLPLCQRLVVLDTGRKLIEGEPHTVTEHEDVIRVYLGGRFKHGKAGAAAAEAAT